MIESRAVGVLGGTFDPVHHGHLQIAERVRRAFGLPRVLLLLAGIPPHKPAHDLAPIADREAMLRLALSDRPGLELSTLESATGRVGYTIDTLRRLRADPPGCDPLFIVGQDALTELTTWRAWSELLDEFDLVAVGRGSDGPGETEAARLDPRVAARIVPIEPVLAAERALAPLRPGAGGRVFRLRFTPLVVSSSEVRARVAAGLGLDDLVPAAVAAYIGAKGLYRGR